MNDRQNQMTHVGKYINTHAAFRTLQSMQSHKDHTNVAFVYFMRENKKPCVQVPEVNLKIGIPIPIRQLSTGRRVIILSGSGRGYRGIQRKRIQIYA